MIEIDRYYFVNPDNPPPALRRVCGMSQTFRPRSSVAIGQRKGQIIKVEVPVHFAGQMEFTD